MRRRRKSSTSDIILTVLATSIVLTSPVATRLLVRSVIEEMGKKIEGFNPADSEENRIRSSLYRLRRDGYIERVFKDGKARFALTDKGKQRISIEQGYNFSVRKQEKWDGLWRFAMFDIPERERKLRGVLRDSIRAANFFQIQKSIWVHPYPCTKEIETLADSLGIRSYLLLFEGKINREDELKKFFIKKGYPLK